MSLSYRVIQKSEIPPTPPPRTDNYGEWTAIARLIRRLAPDQAVAVDLNNLTPSVVVSSLHAAARTAGIKVTTMRAEDGRVYVTRAGIVGDETQFKVYEFTCKACGAVRETNRPNQEYCRSRKCQNARHAEANRALYLRKKLAQAEAAA